MVHVSFDSHGGVEIKKETILDMAKGGEFRPNNLESFAEERNLKGRRRWWLNELWPSSTNSEKVNKQPNTM